MSLCAGSGGADVSRQKTVTRFKNYRQPDQSGEACVRECPACASQAIAAVYAVVARMQHAMPSRTALRVAMRRAAHQLYDRPLVFKDPIAVQILGARYADEVRRTPLHPDRSASTSLRAAIIARSRYAEDNLARAVASGVSQYVLLGSGLDTFAYRNPYQNLRVFEIDHPATQQWKRELLAENHVSIPETLTYVPVDFEQQSLAQRLDQSGFDGTRPAFFAWLGVIPYLTLPAFRETIAFIASRAPGSGVVFDYAQPREVLPLTEQREFDSLAARVKLAGEPFQLFFTPAQMVTELLALRMIEDLGAEEITARYFAGRSDNLRMRGTAGRLLSAWR
jgi:methyltransferase (TIGR00027 family)